MIEVEELAIALYVEEHFGQRKDFKDGRKVWLKLPAVTQGVWRKQAKRIIQILVDSLKNSDTVLTEPQCLELMKQAARNYLSAMEADYPDESKALAKCNESRATLAEMGFLWAQTEVIAKVDRDHPLSPNRK